MKNFCQFLNHLSLLVLIVMFSSCASDRTVKSSKVRTGLDQYNNGYEMTKGENGMAQSGSDKVSDFNGKMSNIGGQDFAGKNYNTESYRKERWSGKTQYKVQEFAGNTDGSRFQHSPYYVDRNARARDNGQYAAANGSEFAAGNYAGAYQRANEGGFNAIQSGESGYVTSRSDNTKPLIVSKEDYRRLTIDDSKRMLGKE